MRFQGVCLITGDLPRLSRFYSAVLQMEAQGDDTFASLAVSGAALTMFTEQGMDNMAPGSMRDSGAGGCVLEFEVNDVDEEYKRLEQLAVIVVKPPTTQSWGIRSIWFRDPDGNLINYFARARSESS